MMLAVSMIVLTCWIGMLCLGISTHTRFVKMLCVLSITCSSLALINKMECIRHELLCAAVCTMTIMVLPFVKTKIRNGYCYAAVLWMAVFQLMVEIFLVICKVVFKG